MKISLGQTIAIVCILAVGFMTAAPFVQTAEAEWTKKTTYNYTYECLLKDGTVCIEPTSWTRIVEKNTWWHRKWNHQDDHPQTEDEVSRSRTQRVNGCSECDPPSL